MTLPSAKPADPLDPESLKLAPHILEEAADWLMHLHSGLMTSSEHEALERWCERSAMHRQVWARTARLLDKLGGLPPAIAIRALDPPDSRARRAAVVRLAVLLAAIPAGWTTWRLASSQTWSADYRTSTGERLEIQLADGTRVTLNTDTAIDIRFDTSQRQVLLRAGEIFITTATDSGPTHRPFVVGVQQGRLEALGTRFNVRQMDGVTRVAVFEGAVRIDPFTGQKDSERIVAAGQQTTFSAETVSAMVAADETLPAWTHGMMVANRTPLSRLTTELARYRRGVVRCDPSIAQLLVSGAFPVSDTDRALNMLAQTLPVIIVTRTPYWVTLVPRAEH